MLGAPRSQANEVQDFEKLDECDWEAKPSSRPKLYSTCWNINDSTLSTDPI